jgi:hypothetical protein
MSRPPRHRRSPAIHPTSRCSSVWGRCRVVSRWRAALVRPQCHRRPLAPTTSSGSSAWGWVQHCHLSSLGGPVPTIHPASSCSQGWKWVGCRTSPSAWNCCFEQLGSQWRVTDYFCRQYSPCQYPTGPSSCFGPPSSSPPVLVALHNRLSRNQKKSIFSVK